MTQPQTTSIKQKFINVLHVCESAKGGPATYINVITAYQSTNSSVESVSVILPENDYQFLDSTSAKLIPYKKSGRNITSILSLIRAIDCAISSQEYDIIHLHSTFAGAIGRVLRLYNRNARRAKVLYCAHGWSFDEGRHIIVRSIFALAERILLPLSDAIINISPHETKLTGKWLSKSKKQRLVISGLPDNVPAAPRQSPRSTDRIQLLFVGRYDHQKGLDLLMAEMARSQHLPLQLTIAGGKVVNGSTFEIPENVRDLGWLRPEEVAHVMAQADAIIMPSRWEGLPLAAIEAMRAGKPIIANDTGAFPFIVSNGDTGFLIDATKPGFLTDLLPDLSHEKLYVMGQTSRKRYERDYTANRMNDELMGLYQDLIK